MNFADLRNASHSEARRLGYATNPSLPLLDANLCLRLKNQITLRALTLHCVVAASHGFPKERSLEWLHREHLTDSLAPKERAFLIGPVTDAIQFQVQGECLWVFAWVLGRVERLDFAQPAPDYLVTLYPDLKKSESSAQWREHLSLRPQAEVLAACDLAYCLHWAINQSRVNGRKRTASLKPYVIVERRRALEWLLGQAEWDDVELDT
jgi:hypothetical protein